MASCASTSVAFDGRHLDIQSARGAAAARLRRSASVRSKRISSGTPTGCGMSAKRSRAW